MDASNSTIADHTEDNDYILESIKDAFDILAIMQITFPHITSTTAVYRIADISWYSASLQTDVYCAVLYRQSLHYYSRPHAVYNGHNNCLLLYNKWRASLYAAYNDSNTRSKACTRASTAQLVD